MDEVLVSVCIPTYNQSLYIADAIEGCVNQITQYPYEIIIRDDCSTDNTKNIIENYRKKYPELIKLVVEKENQYSQGGKIFAAFRPYIKGKYIALNEGDDYWNDPYKLEKQVSFLEAHTNYALAVHGANIINDDKKIIGCISPDDKEQDFTTEDLIAGGGEMIATNSMVFKSKYIYELPSFYYNAYVEDYPLTIFLSTKGLVHYFPMKMSTYRSEAKGSWTRKKRTGNVIQRQIDSCEKVINLLEDIDKFYLCKYNAVIKERIEHFEANKFILLGETSKLRETFPERYVQLTVIEKLIMRFKHYFPQLYNFLKTRN